jgi:hypothetical protein
MPRSRKHPAYEMYFALYPDGTLSANFYSFARAKNHTVVLAETVGRNDGLQSAVQGALVRLNRTPLWRGAPAFSSS